MSADPNSASYHECKSQEKKKTRGNGKQQIKKQVILITIRTGVVLVLVVTPIN
jgi:hypothetical protein